MLANVQEHVGQTVPHLLRGFQHPHVVATVEDRSRALEDAIRSAQSEPGTTKQSPAGEQDPARSLANEQLETEANRRAAAKALDKTKQAQASNVAGGRPADARTADGPNELASKRRSFCSWLGGVFWTGFRISVDALIDTLKGR